VGAVGNLDLYLDLSSPSVSGPKQLYFYHINPHSGGNVGYDSLYVLISTNGGASWGVQPLAGYDTAQNWARHSVAITQNPNTSSAIIRFQGKTVNIGNSTDIGIDSVYVVGPCSGAPAPGSISTTGIPAPVCPGNSLGLTTVGTTMGGGLSFQWEQSLDNVTWTNAVGGQGATTQFYTTPPLYDTVWYRMNVTCSGNTATTPAQRIDVVTPYYANIPYSQSFETWVTAGSCGALSLPDTVWANAPYIGNSSWRRHDQGNYGGWGTTINTGAYSPVSIAGLRSARFHSSVASTLTSGSLDLLLDCSQQTGTKELQFHYLNTSGNDSLGVSYSKDNGFTFTSMGYFTTTAVGPGAPTGWTEYRLPLPSDSAHTIIRFTGYADAGNSTDIGLDSVRVVEPCSNAVTAGVINNLMSACKNDPFFLYLIGNTQAAGITYDWQSSLDNINWISTSNTGYTYTTSITQPTFYRVVVKCAGSNTSDTTPVHLVDTTQFYYCYCTSGATTASGADVGNVTLASLPGNVIKLNNGTVTSSNLTNNPQANKTYTDFRYTLQPPTQLYQDSSYSLSVTQINSSSYTNAVVTVWIDTSMDGFFDPNEIFLQKATSSSGFPPQEVDTTFMIPGTLDTGITGMRVIVQEGTTPPSPCGTYTGGETEDYLVRIYYPPCDGPANPGTAEISDTSACIGYTIYVSDTTYEKHRSGLLRVWQESPDNISWADIVGSDTMDVLEHVVTAPTYFRMQLVCANPVQLDTTHSNVVHVSVNPPVSCYCLSQAVGGVQGDSSDIGAFLFENLSNNVGGPHLLNPEAWRRHTDYTNQPAPELWIDSTYQFSLYHIMRSATHQDAKVTIFIDFDADLEYDIPGELVYTGYTAATNFNIMGSLTIAHNALPDLPTGMRVILNNDVGPNLPSDIGCGEYTSGETEDYVVIIRSPLTGVSTVNNIGYMNLFPNPADDRFTLSYKMQHGVRQTTVTVADITGKKLWEQDYGGKGMGGTFSEQITLSGIAQGVYFVTLRADNETMVRKLIIK